MDKWGEMHAHSKLCKNDDEQKYNWYLTFLIKWIFFVDLSLDNKRNIVKIPGPRTLIVSWQLIQHFD